VTEGVTVVLRIKIYAQNVHFAPPHKFQSDKAWIDRHTEKYQGCCGFEYNRLENAQAYAFSRCHQGESGQVNNLARILVTAFLSNAPCSQFQGNFWWYD
jgi:hypothetical protein